MTIPLRSDYTAGDLRALAARSKDAHHSRRLLSIAAIYDGMNRADAARIGGMDRQTLRDWGHRFNADGPAGLFDRWSPGPARKLGAGQTAAFAAIVEAGPDLDTDGLVRWRRADLKAVVETRFGVTYSLRSVSRLLHELGFSHISARPHHRVQDRQTLEAFKKTSPPRWPPISATWPSTRPSRSGFKTRPGSARRTA